MIGFNESNFVLLNYSVLRANNLGTHVPRLIGSRARIWPIFGALYRFGTICGIMVKSGKFRRETFVET